MTAPDSPVTAAGRRAVSILRQHWGEPFTTDTIRSIEADVRSAIEQRFVQRFSGRPDLIPWRLMVEIGEVISGDPASREAEETIARRSGANDHRASASPDAGPVDKVATLRVAARAFLNAISAAEADGWTWAGGNRDMKAHHPQTGDLYSAHANFAVALARSNPAFDPADYEPAVDDFGNQYLARRSAADVLRDAVELAEWNARPRADR